MPDGAQAWKIIRPPGAKSDRIAQACDRCRSKKIKCDGLRPHCSQCLAVGFECKISDRLLRRAFPRGYTECLEDRIRQLEQENTKLLGLLDVKDEQLELVSRVESTLSPNKDVSKKPSDKTEPIEPVQSHQQPPTPDSSLARSSTESVLSLVEDEEDQEYYSIHQSTTLTCLDTYTGCSSGCGMVIPLMEKMKEKRLNDDAIESVLNCAKAMDTSQSKTMKSTILPPNDNSQYKKHIPLAFPQITTDQFLTIYFQEWQPIFPVLDDGELWTLSDSAKTSLGIDQIILYLALSLASLSTRETKVKDKNVLEAWRLRNEWKFLFTLQLETTPSIRTVQALALALTYSLHTGQFDDIWHYRGSAVSMMQQLGLSQCQKKLKNEHGQPLTLEEQELRRRLFWIIYTLDSLSSAVLGSPPLVRMCDVACALPDAKKSSSEDDDFPLALNDPSAASNNDAALKINTCFSAIIELGQVVSGILESIYCCTEASHSYKTIYRLENRLESWRKRLAEPLVFDLRHGRPAMTLVPLHQKSPLFLMLYDYARILIHGPALSGSINSSTRTSGSHVAIMQAAKSYLQTYNYLNARHVTATLPLPQGRLIMLYGCILFHGTLDYSKGGSLIQESKDIIMSALKELELQCQVEWPGGISRQCLEWLTTASEAVFPAARRKVTKSPPTISVNSKETETDSTPETASQCSSATLISSDESEQYIKQEYSDNNPVKVEKKLAQLQSSASTEAIWSHLWVLDELWKNRTVTNEAHSSITIPSTNTNSANFMDSKEHEGLSVENDSDPLSYLLLDDLFKEVSWVRS